MKGTITVTAEDDGTYTLLSNEQIIDRGLGDLTNTLSIASLLLLCDQGDKDACRELDIRGIEPPMLELDTDAVAHLDRQERADRAEAIINIGIYASGLAIVGLESDGDTVRLCLEGGRAIVMHGDGRLEWLDPALV